LGPNLENLSHFLYIFVNIIDTQLCKKQTKAKISGIIKKLAQNENAKKIIDVFYKNLKDEAQKKKLFDLINL